MNKSATKMGKRGLEQPRFPKQKTPILVSGAARCAARVTGSSLREIVEAHPDLRELIAVWPRLSPDARGWLVTNAQDAATIGGRP